MKNRKQEITVIGRGVTVIRENAGGRIYFKVTRSSLARIHRAVTNAVNKQYGPSITLFDGGYEVEW